MFVLPVRIKNSDLTNIYEPLPYNKQFYIGSIIPILCMRTLLKHLALNHTTDKLLDQNSTPDLPTTNPFSKILKTEVFCAHLHASCHHPSTGRAVAIISCPHDYGNP